MERMEHSSSPEPKSPEPLGQSRGRDRLIDGILIPALIALTVVAAIFVTKTDRVLRKPLWLDEVHTALLVSDPSLSHAFRALAHGGDYNPPTLFLMTKAMCLVTGETRPGSLRQVSLVSVILGLIGIFAIVRRPHGRLVGLAAAAAAWSHPLLIHHIFEARFYGPWFAFIVWFAYALNLADRSGRKPWSLVFVAVMAVLVSTIHYFGVFSLALVAGSHFLTSRASIRSMARGLIPVAAGPAALIACLPLYRGQRAALSVPTWIPRPTLTDIRFFFEYLYVYHVALIAVLVYFLYLVTFGRASRPARDGESRGSAVELAGLAGLILMPVAICGISLVLQPSLIPRYAITVVASLGIIIAPILARSGRVWATVALSLFLMAGVSHLLSDRRNAQEDADLRAGRAKALSQLGDRQVLFRKRRTLYECWWGGPPTRSKWLLWDPTELPDRMAAVDTVERDVAAVLHTWYDMPGSATVASRREPGIFYLFGFKPAEVDALKSRVASLTTRLIDEDSQVYEANTSATAISPTSRGPGTPDR